MSVAKASRASPPTVRSLRERLTVLTAERRRLGTLLCLVAMMPACWCLLALAAPRPGILEGEGLKLQNSSGEELGTLQDWGSGGGPAGMVTFGIVGSKFAGGADFYITTEGSALELSVPEERGKASISADARNAYLALFHKSDRIGEIPPEKLIRLFLSVGAREADLGLMLRDGHSIAPEEHLGWGHIRAEFTIGQMGQPFLVFRDASEEPVWSVPPGLVPPVRKLSQE